MEQKQYDSRVKKERKTIADGNKILDCIEVALKEGKSAYGFTMGNVSLIQIVEMITQKFGGGFEFATCIWSANQVDIQRLYGLKRNGFISKAKFLVDPSAYTRKFDAIQELYDSFGISSVRTLPTHAKFVTLKNDKHSFAITSSMNFTHNPRIEQFEVVECEQTSELMSSIVDNAFEKYTEEDNFTGQAMSKFSQIKKNLKSKDSQDFFTFEFDNIPTFFD